MSEGISAFIKLHSCDIETTNRLVVSLFLKELGLSCVRNGLINSLLIKETDNDYALFLALSREHNILDFEGLIKCFEFVISPGDKVVTGAVYTPEGIRDFISERSIIDSNVRKEITICDFSCGCGGFLFSSAKILKKILSSTYKEIFSKNLFGVDLKDYSVDRSRILLSLLAIVDGEDMDEFDFNLYAENSLGFYFEEVIPEFDGFDVVLGNPPYVCSRNIDFESRELLKNWNVSSVGHPDLYIPFFEIGVKALKKDGVLGYITMNSFFRTLNARLLRKFFSESSYKFQIIDFGGSQVFKSKSTYTCVCFIKNKKSSFLEYVKTSPESLSSSPTISFEAIQYNNLDDYRGWGLNTSAPIRKIESIGRPFIDVFKTSTGIATLKNNVYIFDYIEEDALFFYMKDGSPIEKSVCFDVVNSNKLTRESSLNKIKKKIIFPYRYKDGAAVIISDTRFRAEYPKAYEYLTMSKVVLSQRDKGKGKYEEWFAYGRRQGLEKFKYKLLFPHIAPKTPNFIISKDSSLLFHNGMSLVGDDIEDLEIASKIMKSRLFWFYISNTSKPYGSGYFSLSRNYIKSFGVYNFTGEQREYLLNEDNQSEIDCFLEALYGVDTQ